MGDQAVTLKKVQAGIEKRLEEMMDRSRALRTYFLTQIYPYYQNLQRTRWMTEGSSEGPAWKAINPLYAAYKRTRFVSYDGHGTKMMIATGRLFKSVIGPGADHTVRVDDRSITIGTTVEYAKFAGKIRPIFKFKKSEISAMKRGVFTYIKTGRFVALRGV